MHQDLSRYGWIAVGAALATITLKAGAWLVTGSVGLLADAAESIVNLVAAVVALIALKVAAKPADKNHHFGHTKAEYFSAGVEGLMIFIAAASIIFFAVQRLLAPQPLEQVGIGLAISLVASAINGGVALVLLRAGARHNSITLRADGKHLMTDVYTSAGVLVGIVLVWVTKWNWLDPVVAIAVGINILIAGYGLVKESTEGLMDISLPKEDNDRLRQLLASRLDEGIDFHQMRTRESGTLQFMEFHLLVPGSWTVKQGHDFLEDLVDEIVAEFPRMSVTGHLEPIEDPRSYEHPL
ncbi:cation transporter [Arachnia propionica]|uniref:Cation transporter n=1 Tax=Arachnia propionica TaxID=1750 RepID=A0A3P1T9Y5_9ACTN|nr:cation diffusion facilitator family transporter [Arachnia propionica]MDO5083657.1 cation diffusion facilitator family transporter [Arachnia propionica]RRD06242.1 cation transporter [Arachnia propionica]